MKFSIRIILFLGLTLPVGAIGQNLQNLTLSEAIQVALENKPGLKTLDLDAQLVAAKTEVLKLKRQPQVSATVDIQLNPVLQTSVIPVGAFNPALGSDATATVRFGTLWQNAAGITAVQTLYDPSIAAQIREQEFQQQLIVADREKTAADLSLEVARAYYAVLIATEELAFAKADSARAQLFYEETRKRQEGGKLLQNEVNSASISMNAAALKLEQTRLNRQQLLKNLCFRMGVDPGRAAEIAFSGNLASSLQQIERQNLEAFDAAALVQNRPELRQLYLDSEWQNLKIEVEKKRTSPTLSATAYAGANNLSDDAPFFAENSWFGNVFVGLKLNVPISAYWQHQQYFPQYRLKQQQNVLKATALKDQYQNDFENARLSHTLALRSMEAHVRDLELTRQNVHLIRDRFSEGVALASAVLNAETAVQQTQYNYLRSAYDLLLADLELRRILGRIK
ncbi:MAG: TolC family protein [Saprospiraceae bacterium]|nr:TolC family protein [Saprospiraceae bacterium]